MKRGSAMMAVVIALVVVGLAVMLYFYNDYTTRKRAAAYQQQLIAERAAEEKRAADEAAAAKLRAEEEEERNRADAEAEAAKKAKELAADKKNAEKRAKIERFGDAEQAFIGAQVEFWTPATSNGEPTWCLVPQDGGEGRIFEFIPGADGKTAQVKGLGENGSVETMTPELFQTRHLNGDVNWFVLRDGKALLRTSKRSENAQSGQDRFNVPEAGSDYDIAETIYGDAAKAVKVYKMKPPAVKWDVAFVTRKGVTVPVGQVAFGEKVTREMFRPAVTKLVQMAASKMNQEVKADAKKKGQSVPSTFQPTHKRTHFLYDKGKVKRTVEGFIYVPRRFVTARKTARNAHQAEQDAERNAEHEAEWKALYAEALRQEREEAAERTAWEKARARQGSVKKAPEATPGIVVQPEHIEAAIDAGTFIYSRVGAAAAEGESK